MAHEKAVTTVRTDVGVLFPDGTELWAERQAENQYGTVTVNKKTYTVQGVSDDLTPRPSYDQMNDLVNDWHKSLGNLGVSSSEAVQPRRIRREVITIAFRGEVIQ